MVPLKPGDSVTLNFTNVHLLDKKGTPQVVLREVAAQATFALDAAGTTLTIRFQNASTATSGAALYALDLGLAGKAANGHRSAASFSGLATELAWEGPTDYVGPTAGTGTFTFAAREAAFRRMEDYFDGNNKLPAGFLPAGGGGVITLQVEAVWNGNREATLKLDPTFYFLLPDPQAPTGRRLQLATRSAQRLNPAR